MLLPRFETLFDLGIAKHPVAQQREGGVGLVVVSHSPFSDFLDVLT